MKTDRRDALALLSSLDRYLAGNKEALTVIRGPSDDGTPVCIARVARGRVPFDTALRAA